MRNAASYQREENSPLVDIHIIFLIGAILTAGIGIVMSFNLFNQAMRYRLYALSVLWSVTIISTLATLTFFFIWCSLMVAPEEKNSTIIGVLLVCLAGLALCLWMTLIVETITRRAQQE